MRLGEEESREEGKEHACFPRRPISPDGDCGVYALAKHHRLPCSTFAAVLFSVMHGRGGGEDFGLKRRQRRQGKLGRKWSDASGALGTLSLLGLRGVHG